MGRKYKVGTNRKQGLLFPPSLDELVGENNPVRAIEEFVNMLDMEKLGFRTTTSLRAEGQPAYSPKLLLKIYIYGYMNKIRSSRMLEKENIRNVEMMWLIQGLKPSYKTIANFRKNNSQALKQVFKEFVLICKGIGLVGGELLAVDGAYLRANASKNRLLMKTTIKKDLSSINDKIDSYLFLLDKADKADKADKQETNEKYDVLASRIETLKAKKEQLAQGLATLEKLKKKQHNLTDPDANLMTKPSHNLMAYNSQIVVDDKHKLIIATEVSTKGNDSEQLFKMAERSKEILAEQSQAPLEEGEQEDPLIIVADAGYYSGKQIKKCVDDKIIPIVPVVKRNKQQETKGLFTRDQFKYSAELDHYICPVNQVLHKSTTTQVRNNKLNFIYTISSKTCRNCEQRAKCLPTQTKSKRIFRWEFEYIVEQHAQRMETQTSKDLIKKRGSMVEHPFGTIKRTLGWDHYLVRGKEKVGGENALISFCYNFKRVLNILGIALFKEMVLAIQTDNLEGIRQQIVDHVVFYTRFLLFVANLNKYELIFSK